MDSRPSLGRRDGLAEGEADPRRRTASSAGGASGAGASSSVAAHFARLRRALRLRTGTKQTRANTAGGRKTGENDEEAEEEEENENDDDDDDDDDDALDLCLAQLTPPRTSTADLVAFNPLEDEQLVRLLLAYLCYDAGALQLECSVAAWLYQVHLTHDATLQTFVLGFLPWVILRVLQGAHVRGGEALLIAVANEEAARREGKPYMHAMPLQGLAATFASPQPQAMPASLAVYQSVGAREPIRASTFSYAHISGESVIVAPAPPLYRYLTPATTPDVVAVCLRVLAVHTSSLAPLALQLVCEVTSRLASSGCRYLLLPDATYGENDPPLPLPADGVVERVYPHRVRLPSSLWCLLLDIMFKCLHYSPSDDEMASAAAVKVRTMALHAVRLVNERASHDLDAEVMTMAGSLLRSAKNAAI